MKKIVILSHNPQRDRQCDDLLAYELEKRGHFVWVRNFLAEDKVALCTIKPDIVVLPEIRCEYTVDLARQLKQWGVKVVVRFCEMGITKVSIPQISQEYLKAIYGNWNVRDCVDLALAYGPEMKELLEKYSTIPPEKIVIVGAMAFDQYFKEFKGLPEKKKPVCLFATGFPYADRNEQYSLPEAKPEDRLHADFVHKCQQYRSKWLKKIPEFIGKHKENFDFAIKCHPGEKEVVYRTVLKNQPITYVSHFNALMALQWADVLVHSGSTMAYEMHLLNKPSFVMHSMTSDLILAQISPEIESFNVSCIGQGSNANKNEIAYLEENCFNPNDGESYVRAADEIEKLDCSQVKQVVPDTWPAIKDPQYLTEGVWVDMQAWTCNACKKVFFARKFREMAKCPWCGIASVKIQHNVEACYGAKIKSNGNSGGEGKQ